MQRGAGQDIIRRPRQARRHRKAHGRRRAKHRRDMQRVYQRPHPLTQVRILNPQGRGQQETV